MPPIIKLKSNKAITLIALVITIIVLLILVAVSIATLTGENGILTKSQIAKTRTEYTSAKEIIRLELVNIRADCITEGKDFTLSEIYQGMEEASNIKIEGYYYNGMDDCLKDKIVENDLEKLIGIVVSANEYEKYKFLIGETGEIKGVLIGKITENTKIGEFQKLSDFESNMNIPPSQEESSKANEKFLILNGDTYIETNISEEEILGDSQEFTIATRIYLNRKMKEQGDPLMSILGNHNTSSGFTWQFSNDNQTLQLIMSNQAVAIIDYSSYYDKWTDLAVTYNKGSVKVYVNGQLVGENPSLQFSPYQNLCIGTGFPPGRNLMGAIQSVKIWNAELLGEEIGQINYNKMSNRN